MLVVMISDVRTDDMVYDQIYLVTVIATISTIRRRPGQHQVPVRVRLAGHHQLDGDGPGRVHRRGEELCRVGALLGQADDQSEEGDGARLHQERDDAAGRDEAGQAGQLA